MLDRQGRDCTYDVNMNTNYNSEAERRYGRSGMRALAAYLDAERRSLARTVDDRQSAA